MKTAVLFLLALFLCCPASEGRAPRPGTIEEAVSILEEGRFEDAAAAFRKLSEELRPGDQRAGSVWRGLGVAYANLGENEKAIEAFLAAVEAEPRNILSRLYLGSCYRLEDRTEEAIPVFLAVLKLDPTVERAHDELWQSYAALGDRYGYDAELAARQTYHIGRLVELDPDYPKGVPRVLDELKYLRAVRARFESGETGRIYREGTSGVASGDPDLPDDGVTADERRAQIARADKI